MPDWYEARIESGIRNLVRLLRDNGINTTYSCEHAMVAEAEAYRDTNLDEISALLSENGYDHHRVELIFYQRPGESLSRSLRVSLPMPEDHGREGPHFCP